MQQQHEKMNSLQLVGLIQFQSELLFSLFLLLFSFFVITLVSESNFAFHSHQGTNTVRSIYFGLLVT